MIPSEGDPGTFRRARFRRIVPSAGRTGQCESEIGDVAFDTRKRSLLVIDVPAGFGNVK
jgi:hypothetical protein